SINDDIFTDMVNQHYPDLAFFSKTEKIIVKSNTMTGLPDSLKNGDTTKRSSKYANVGNKGTSKYKKIKKKTEEDTTEKDFIKYAFITELGDKNFIETY